jgi:hypothetical protein
MDPKPVKDNTIDVIAPHQLVMGVDARQIRSGRLSERFPDSVVEQLPVGRGAKKADFVAWHHYARRLNELFPLEWGVSISHVTVVGKYLLMVVDVRITGVTYSGTGEAEADKEDWGGAHAEAFSQAFRRACALAGLGLYFYGMEKMEAIKAACQREVDDAREAMAESHSRAVMPGEAEEPDVAIREPSQEPPTDQQKERLAELGASGVFTDRELDAYRGRMKEYFTKKGVGLLIREMKEVAVLRAECASGDLSNSQSESSTSSQ